MQKKTHDYENDGINPTVISSPFYLWIPKYKFHMDNYSEWGVKRIEAQTAISIVDDAFTKALSSNKEIGRLYNKIFDIYDTHEIQRFEGNNGRDSIMVLLTNLTSQNMSKLNAKNLIDKAHKWEPSMDLKMSQNNSSLEMLIDTNNTGKEFNRAVLNTNLSIPQKGHFYFRCHMPQNHLLEMQHSCSKLWIKRIINTGLSFYTYTFGHIKKDLFVLPDYLLGKASRS